MGGAAFVISAAIWSHYLKEESMQVFGMAALLGCGTSVILVVSLSMTACLIGSNTVSGQLTSVCYHGIFTSKLLLYG